MRAARPKREKSAVGFEHPAQGPHHCGECRHFAAPHACALVAGRIDAGDWCRLYRPRLHDHPGSPQ